MTKTISILILALFAVLPAMAQTAFFNWASPSSLTPAYTAPDAANRSGEYVGGVEFSDNGVIFKVEDIDVKEKSQSARFYYGYNTSAVELRIYTNSDIVITAPEGKVVRKVMFEGPECGAERIIPYDEKSTYTDYVWTAGTDARTAKFYCESRVELSTVTVTFAEEASVAGIVADNTETFVWYTLSGVSLPSKPSAKGIYIAVGKNGAKRVAIR